LKHGGRLRAAECFTLALRAGARIETVSALVLDG